MSKVITQPNFVFIGPDKTGSTWLFEYLKASSEAFVPICKDLYFFDKYYDRGMDWYLSHFRCDGERVVCDISHDYLFSEEASRRIATSLENAKLFSFLRDPVERSYSQYRYMKKMGLVTGDFYDAIKCRPEIIDNSLYAKHMSKYQSFLESERLRLFLFEDLRENAKKFAEELARYFEISMPKNFEPENTVRGGSSSRNILVTSVLKKLALTLRAWGFENFLGYLKRSELIDRMLFTSEKLEPDLTAQEKTDLYHQFFEADVARLAEISGIEPNRWGAAHYQIRGK